MDRARAAIEALLTEADIRINGDRPWDIQVHNASFYKAVVRGGSLAFGETYIAGYWDSDQLDQLVAQLFRFKVNDEARVKFPNVAAILQAFIKSSGGSKSAAFKIGQHHYELGNDLFERMLDKRMVYSCGYWKDAKNLDEAQEAKLNLICRKIGIKQGQQILDIGCGYGSFAKFAAERYDARVVGVTVSKEQVALGCELCKGLPVEFRLQDYRDVTGSFDPIVSLGIFEHVGHPHYRTYMRVVREHLRDEGLFLLHTIGKDTSENSTDPWINKYIFPNSALPSVAKIGKAIEKLFVMEDWHNFNADYDKTLMAWFENFDSHWPEISTKYGQTFYRMWKYYLLACAGGFRSRNNQLWQIVLSKEGVSVGYRSVR